MVKLDRLPYRRRGSGYAMMTQVFQPAAAMTTERTITVAGAHSQSRGIDRSHKIKIRKRKMPFVRPMILSACHRALIKWKLAPDGIGLTNKTDLKKIACPSLQDKRSRTIGRRHGSLRASRHPYCRLAVYASRERPARRTMVRQSLVRLARMPVPVRPVSISRASGRR